MTHPEKCYACDRRLKGTPFLVDTRDDQTVYVGPGCFRRVKAAGEAGYQPPLGGPRLYLPPVRECQTCGDVSLTCPHEEQA